MADPASPASPNEVYVRGPDGAISAVPAEQYQQALGAGYAPVPTDEATKLRADETAQAPEAAVAAGTGTAEGGVGAGFFQKLTSAATFGRAPSLKTPESRATIQQFESEHPIAAGLTTMLGQAPAYAAGLGLAATGAGAAGLGALATTGVEAAAGAAVGGAQIEGEASSLENRKFSLSNAATAGVVNEAIGRTAAWGLSRALGGSRNLLAGAARKAVADDAAGVLEKGGVLRDFQNAAHADQYHAQLGELGAQDLDKLEANLSTVSDLGAKRERIQKLVTDNPAAQDELRTSASAGLKALRDNLAEEAVTTPQGARLLKHLDARIESLDSANPPEGAKLWRELDENRQALQQHAQDLHQSYDANPSSAWASRDALGAIDAAEAQTREALLRSDAWGEDAVAAQRAYNDPHHQQLLPALDTVRRGLMFSPHTDAEGFRVWRGEPNQVQKFFSRASDDLDGRRLGEYFDQYLSGAEAIAHAASEDSPAASREVLESVRRLRKAQANAALITASIDRTGSRAVVARGVAQVAGGVVGGVTGGPFGAAGGVAAVRGVRFGDWFGRAAKRLGWFRGEVLDMGKLLAKGALPAAEEGVSARLTADLLDSSTKPTLPPTEPPPSGGGGGGPPPVSGVAPTELPPAPPPEGGGYAPQAARGYQGPEMTPSLQAELAGGGAASATGVDAGALPEVARGGEGTTTRRASRMLGGGHGAEEPGTSENGLAWYERMTAAEGGHEARAADDARMQALTEGEFRDFVGHLRSIDAKTPEGGSVADLLESHISDLRDSELLVADDSVPPPAESSARATAHATEVPEAGWTPPPTAPGDRPGLGWLRREGVASAEAPAEPAIPASPGGEAVGVMQGLGLSVRTPDRMAPVIEATFDGRVPSKAEWRDVMPMDVLQELGGGAPSHTAVRTMGRDGFSWEATGPMHEGADGYTAESYQISRTFSRDGEKLEVHHDNFFIHPDLQGSGAGVRILQRQMQAYRKMGVDVVSVDCILIGKYFWPSIGFNNKAEVPAAKQAYRQWLQRNAGFSASQAESLVSKIQSLPSLANTEHGKAFLMAEQGPWNHGLILRLRDENPLYHLMRGRLSIMAAGAGALVLAGSIEGEARASEDGKPPAHAQAAAHSAQAATFAGIQTRTLTELARSLFASPTRTLTQPATAPPQYTRAQLEKRQAEVRDWVENPNELVQRVAAGFRDAPPGADEPLYQAVWQAATFLKSKLPQAQSPDAITLRRAPVSTEQLNKFGRYEQAALNPRAALNEAAQRRYVSPELHETLGELYPDMLAELRVHAMMTIKGSGGAPTIQAKAAYARLFDGDGTLADPAFAPMVMGNVEAAYAQVAAVKPSAPAASPTPGVSRLAVPAGFPGALGQGPRLGG